MTMRRGWRPALQQSRALSTANPLKLPVRIRHRADQIAREADQPDLPPPLQPLGAQDRAHLVETAFDMLVDQHIVIAVPVADLRSEEHTSELQSLMRISYAVFCLKK